jgi:hypothetical protein
MNALDLLLDLERRRVVLAPHGEKLIVDAPTGALTVRDRDWLYELKPDLLAILEPNRTPDDLPPDGHQLWDERAAIMEFDGGLCRERAEALALADLLQSFEWATITLRHRT